MHTSIAAAEREETVLLEWAEYVKTTFQVDNGVFLPLDSMEESGSIRIRDVNEFMRKAVEQLQQNRLEISDLRTQIQNQKHELHNIHASIHASNDALHNKFDSILSRLSTPSSSVDPINYLEVQLPHMLDEFNSFETPTALAPNNLNVMENFVSYGGGASASTPLPQPANEEGTKSLTISAVFYDWFMNQRYNTVTQPGTREKFNFNETWKTIAHLKRFLPSNYVITTKPSTDQDLSGWTRSLATISREVQSAAMNFLNDKAAATGGSGKRRRIEPLFSATYKRFMAIPAQEFPSPTNVNDLATPPMYQEDISTFRIVKSTTSTATNNQKALARTGLRGKKNQTQQQLNFAAALLDDVDVHRA